MIKNLIISGIFLICAEITFAQNTAEEYLKNYENRIKQERINDVYIPKDLKDAMRELDRLTNKKAAAKIKNKS